MTALIVTSAFGPYQVGTLITDSAAVSAILAGEDARNVVQTNTGTTPTISTPSISGLISGSSSVVSGSYANGTPSGLSYSLDGAASVSAANPSISAGVYSFVISTPLAGTHALVVSGTGGNTATSGSATFLTANAVGGGGGTAYTGIAPIDVTGSVISLKQTGVSAGQVLQYSGSAWGPATIPPGSGVGYNPRGPWLANTAYAVGDVVTYQGSSYVTPTAFTSGATFSSPNWILQAQAGAAGASGNGAGTVNTGAANQLAAYLSGGSTVSGLGLSSSFSIAGSTLTLASVALSLLAQSGATTGQALSWNGTTWAPATIQVSLGTATPLANGTAAAGTAVAASHEDHRHPTDATRAPLANPAFTGSITLPTWTTSTRPASPALGMEGYATDSSRRETYTGAGWVQYVRTGDIPAATGGLLGGTGTPGMAAAVSLSARLSLTSGTLDIAAVPPSLIAQSGATTGQVLAWSGTAWAPGTVSGGGQSYTMPAATSSQLGGIKLGASLVTNPDGTTDVVSTSVGALTAAPGGAASGDYFSIYRSTTTTDYKLMVPTPDGATLQASGSNVWSVITASTHTLNAGTPVATDEISFYSVANSADVKVALGLLVGLLGSPTKPSISGSRNGNAALASLITGLAQLGLLTDATSA